MGGGMTGFNQQPQVNFVGQGANNNNQGGFSSFQAAEPAKDKSKVFAGGLVDLNNLQMSNT